MALEYVSLTLKGQLQACEFLRCVAFAVHFYELNIETARIIFASAENLLCIH